MSIEEQYQAIQDLESKKESIKSFQGSSIKEKLLFNIMPKSIPAIETRISSIESEIQNEDNKIEVFSKYKLKDITGLGAKRAKRNKTNLEGEVKKLSTLLDEKIKKKVKFSSKFIKDLDGTAEKQKDGDSGTAATQTSTIKTMNMDIKKTSSLIETNEEILEKLTEIEENQVDEQNTELKSIKRTSSIQKVEGPLKAEEPKKERSLFGLITGILGGIFGLAGMKALKNLASLGVGEIFRAVGSMITGAVSGVLTTMKNMISKIPGVSKIVDGAKALKNKVSATLTKGKEVIKEKASKAKNFVVDKASKAKSFVSNVWKSTKEKIVNTYSKAKSVVSNKITSVKEFVKTKAAGKVTKSATKVIGPKALTTIKVIAKKIPGISILAGLGFGLHRALKGDFEGAGLEVLSGLASTIPGPGTAMSLGLDGALIAKDMNQAVNSNKSKMQADGVTVPKPVEENVNRVSEASMSTAQSSQKVNTKKDVAVQTNKAKKEAVRDNLTRNIVNNTRNSVTNTNVVTQPVASSNTNNVAIAVNNKEESVNDNIINLFHSTI